MRNVTKYRNMWQHVRTLNKTLQNTMDSWPFCENNISPDIVWKPRRRTQCAQIPMRAMRLPLRASPLREKMPHDQRKGEVSERR